MHNLEKISFPGKREHERVLLLLRRHWIILLAHSIVSLVLLFVPTIGALLLNSLFPGIGTSTIYPYLVLLFWIYLMFVWSYFFVGWIDYYLDAWIVTNDRIINIEQNGLFNRVISEQRLYRVQDVTAQVGGPIQTFFNFGRVYIQTAAETERFVFEDVPEPYHVKKIIIELHEKALEAEYARQAAVDTMVSQDESFLHEQKKHFYMNPDMMTPGVGGDQQKDRTGSGHHENLNSQTQGSESHPPHSHHTD